MYIKKKTCLTRDSSIKGQSDHMLVFNQKTKQKVTDVRRRSCIEFYCSVRVFHVANSLIPDLGRNTRAKRFDVAIAKKTSRYKIQPKN